MPFTFNYGRPGIGSALSASYGRVFRAEEGKEYFPHGGVIDGTSRYYAGGTNLFLLPPGLLMGQITSTKKWAPTIIGISTGAITGAGTSLTVSAAQATELVRRVGASGTFTVLGPSSANGTARTATATYSAVDTTTGVITITALGTNQAEDVRFSPAATGGNVQLTVSKPDGTRVTTGNAAWNATDATFLGNINTALDTATGVTGGIVATAISATDTDSGFTLTYSGTGYAGLTWPEAQVAVLPTSVTNAYVEPRTTAVGGAFAAGSWVLPSDGSEIPRTVIDDGYGITVPSDSSDRDFPRIPRQGCLDTSKIIGYPTDTGMQAWLKDKLCANGRGLFTFSDEYGAA